LLALALLAPSSAFCKPACRCAPAPQRGTPCYMQERVWLNQGGERVVRDGKKKKPPRGDDDEPDFDRRLLVVGLMAQPAFFAGASMLRGRSQSAAPSKGSLAAQGEVNMDGDAVTSPLLELQMIDVMENTPGARPGDANTPQYAQMMALLPQLEERGGSQLAAASMTGRWILPWVGGWERLWTSQADASTLGGPKELEFTGPGGRTYTQVSARQFVYGPGEGGIICEFLHESPGVDAKLLLTRPGVVTNLGENVFQLDFPQPLQEYEVKTNSTTGAEALVSGVQLSGGAERAPPLNNQFQRTTYLSERFWVLRDATDDKRISVYQRTYARSVLDRRGLVMEGQLKPSADESIRYGRLLFGDTADEYKGWEEKAQKGIEEKNKLFGR